MDLGWGLVREIKSTGFFFLKILVFASGARIPTEELRWGNEAEKVALPHTGLNLTDHCNLRGFSKQAERAEEAKKCVQPT